MKKLLFLLICAFLAIAATNPPKPVVGTPGGDSNRTNKFSVIWGNYIWPDAPSKPPTLRATDLTAGNARFVDRNYSLTNARPSTLEFKAHDGVRQLVWMAETIANASGNRPEVSFSVNGFQWQLYPAPNTPCQQLVINGVTGRLYMTSEQNSGGQSSATHDPIIVQ